MTDVFFYSKQNDHNNYFYKNLDIFENKHIYVVTFDMDFSSKYIQCFNQR